MDSDQQTRTQHGTYQTSAANRATQNAGKTASNGPTYSLNAQYDNPDGPPAWARYNYPPYVYNDSSGRNHGPRFGLIRGYHRQMYETIPGPQGPPCCDCAQGNSKDAYTSDGCNWGVACGCVLLIIGVIAILMGFMVPQKVSERPSHLTNKERDELKRINLFIDIFVISGLSVLCIGGLLISIALLLPLLKRRARQRCQEPIRYFGREVYVKAESAPTIDKAGKPSIDLGFHKDVLPGDVALRKVQPQSEKSEPIDLNIQSKSG